MQDVNSAPIPSNLADRPASRINMKFVAGGLLIMLFVGYLATQMVQATMSTGAYYLTVAEVHGRGAEALGQRIRVSGNVVEGSEDWNAKEITLKWAARFLASAASCGPFPERWGRRVDTSRPQRDVDPSPTPDSCVSAKVRYTGE